MGPIQSSINQLTGTVWATAAAAGTLAKKMALPGKEQATQQPKTNVTNSMGNIVKQGRLHRNAYAKSTAYLSADNMINEKAPSLLFSVDDRIAQASSISIGGKK